MESSFSLVRSPEPSRPFARRPASAGGETASFDRGHSSPSLSGQGVTAAGTLSLSVKDLTRVTTGHARHPSEIRPSPASLSNAGDNKEGSLGTHRAENIGRPGMIVALLLSYCLTPKPSPQGNGKRLTVKNKKFNPNARSLLTSKPRGPSQGRSAMPSDSTALTGAGSVLAPPRPAWCPCSFLLPRRAQLSPGT